MSDQVADRDADKDATQYSDKNRKDGHRWTKKDHARLLQDYCKIEQKLLNLPQSVSQSVRLHDIKPPFKLKNWHMHASILKWTIYKLH